MNVISNANTPTALAARPVTVNNSPEGAAPGKDTILEIKDSIDIGAVTSKAGDVAKIAGTIAKHATRSVPGVINVALNSPNLVVSPMLNGFAPATTNRDAIYLERWGNVLGGAALGGVAGAVLTNLLASEASVGQIIGMGVAGLAGGVAVGGAKSIVTSWWTPTIYDGGERRTVAKYPQIGEAARAAKNAAGGKSYGTGAAIRAGYKAGFVQSYENGAHLADELGKFSKGLLGFQE